LHLSVLFLRVFHRLCIAGSSCVLCLSVHVSAPAGAMRETIPIGFVCTHIAAARYSMHNLFSCSRVPVMLQESGGYAVCEIDF
ncbi:MAG: hypothetical protein Q4C12_04940, partial [Clostridia bacterium]|nr:hypothetical protein [Clostridia bacterium]